MIRTGRSLTVAAAFASALMAGSALAQTPAPAPAAAPLDRGSALYGRPESADAAKLAPVAPPPIPTPAARLPTAKLHVPEGFKVEVYAAGVGNARSMRLGDKGTLFVGSRLLDKVYAVTQVNGAPVVKVIASGLHRPNGLAFANGNLYVAELSRVSRYDNIEANLDTPPKPVLIYDDLPKDEAHGWKFIGIGPDNKLYVPIGSPGNIIMPPPTHAQIRRMDLDGKNVETVALGVRNSVGFDWNPVTKDFWFTNNGRDWVSEDIPEDTLHRVAAGTTTAPNFGFPLLPPGQLHGPGIRLGPLLQRVRQARRPDGRPHRRARHALLHRLDVPGRVQERHLHGPPRLLEPHHEARRRHRGREAERRRQREVHHAVHDRLPREQQLQRPPRGRAAAPRRLPPGLR